MVCVVFSYVCVVNFDCISSFSYLFRVLHSCVVFCISVLCCVLYLWATDWSCITKMLVSARVPGAGYSQNVCPF